MTYVPGKVNSAPLLPLPTGSLLVQLVCTSEDAVEVIDQTAECFVKYSVGCKVVPLKAFFPIRKNLFYIRCAPHAKLLSEVSDAKAKRRFV